MQLTPETTHFIQAHRKDDVRSLALKADRYPDVDMPSAIIQIAGRQIISHKVPSWSEVDGLFYPRHLSLEQCSSEVTARYKASLVKGTSLVDLTGGFGVDCAFLSECFAKVTYVEQQRELCEIVSHNFPLLGLNHITVVNGNAVDYLRQMDKVDCIFIDPARRNENGGKTIAISDCTPDVEALSSLLLEKADTVLIKLSPMLDLALALERMPLTHEIRVLSVNNECKELLLVLKKEQVDSCRIFTFNIERGGNTQLLDLTREEEQNASCEYTSTVDKYIYEPNASILKAGAYKSISAIYKIKKLHPNSHLYTSDEWITDFPGRMFVCQSVVSFNKKEIKKQFSDMTKANIAVRNFPASVAELRKRMKLGDGGNIYFFATTLVDEKKVLLKCVKAIL